MNKETLTKLLDEGYTNTKIGEILFINRRKVAELLIIFGLKKDKIINTNCSLCKKEIINNERNRRLCQCCVTRVRRLRMKIKAVDYLGGECKKCGYNKSLSALDFHHLDANKKDFNIAKNSNKSWDFLKKELDKCVLLCSNCHREEHNKYDEILNNKILTNYGKGFYKNEEYGTRINKKFKVYYCECGKEIHRTNTKCKDCFDKKRRKVDRPSHTQLIEDIGKMGYVATGRKYSVSDNAIRRWIKYYEK